MPFSHGDAMNFLVSNNNEIIERFQKVLIERDSTELLRSFSELLIRGEICKNGLAIIDATVPGYEDVAGIKQLKLAHPSLKILLVGEQLTPMQELAALAAGAMGCCLPSLGEDQLHRIISIVEEGGVWISNSALPYLLTQLRKRSPVVIEPPAQVNSNSHHLDGMAVLTKREREISQMVAEGLSNKVIARRLDITDRTVKAHLTVVFQKLHVHDRLQLALYVTKDPQN
jgi:two-component system, NarL family, nitrate/nitrite response regulator NarL